MTAHEAIAQRYLLARKSEILAGMSRDPLLAERHADLIEEIDAEAQREQAARDLERDTQMLRAVTEALERIDAGTYGVCECGADIAPVRLVAVPWAALCRECQERAEMEACGRAA